MSAERDFSTYRLHDNVYELAGGLLPEMALGLGYGGLGEEPSRQVLEGFIGRDAPAKTLQDNIGLVQDRLGTSQSGADLALSWVERSGVMLPVDRGFVIPEIKTPEDVDLAVITGGVARWWLRRTQRLIHFMGEDEEGRPRHTVGKVVLAAGNRKMGAGEHQLVKDWQGEPPTEFDFMQQVIKPKLESVGIASELVEVDSQEGWDVMSAVAASTKLVDLGTTVVIGNSPAVVMNTAQLREVGRAIDPGYDNDGSRLFMVSELDGVDEAGIPRAYPLADKGQPAATHQNPLTAIGQIQRNALHLYYEQERLFSITRTRPNQP